MDEMDLQDEEGENAIRFLEERVSVTLSCVSMGGECVTRGGDNRYQQQHDEY